MSLHTSPLAQPGQGDAGGLNVYVTNVARVLRSRGHSPAIFTADWPAGLASPATLPEGTEVHHIDIPATSKNDMPQHREAAARALARHPVYQQADAVWAHYWISALVALDARTLQPPSPTPNPAPIAVSFHTIGAVKNHDTGTDREPDLRLQTEAWIARNANLLVANTQAEAQAMRRFLSPAARIVVAQPGVNHDIFRPSPDNAQAPRPAHEAGRGRGFSLLCVGRMQYIKGTDVALRALARLRADGVPARLTMLGAGSGGPDTRDFEDLAANLGIADAVDFLPPVPPAELAQFYRQVDLVVVPSRSESFGIAAAEAAASGACVLASRVGGLPSVVIDQVTGVLVAPGDAQELARAAAELLADPARRARLGAAASEHARAFTWETCVDTVVTHLSTQGERHVT